MTYKSLHDSSDEETRHSLNERAAIHEFDGQLTRLEAERRTVEEFLRQDEQKDLLLL